MGKWTRVNVVEHPGEMSRSQKQIKSGYVCIWAPNEQSS